MDLSKILTISGKSGLFKLVAQTKTGLIVESLTDNKRFPTHATDKINNLNDITVYSTDSDMPLKDVFRKISEKEQGNKAIDPKSDDNTLRKFFESALPEYDKERVYASDIKKIITWYNILQSTDMLKFAIEVPEKEKSSEEQINTNEPANPESSETSEPIN